MNVRVGPDSLLPQQIEANEITADPFALAESTVCNPGIPVSL